MRSKPSLDGKSKRQRLARAKEKLSRGSSSKRRRRLQVCQEPAQTDSTIATFTVFIGGEGSGEGVRVVKNSPPVDPGDKVTDPTGGPDSAESEESQQKSDARHLPDKHEFRDIFNSRKRSKSKERCPKSKMYNFDESAQTVYNLEESLPTEVRDLLSCRGGNLCFHDHERVRVVNNKIHVRAKQNRSKPQIKKRASPSRQSLYRVPPAKRVTFSPGNKRHKSAWNRRKSISPDRKIDIAATDRQSVPPPPSGYHLRVVPSSVDGSIDNPCTDDSTWTQTERSTASKLSNIDSQSEPLERIKKSSHCTSHEKRLPIKEVKEHFKRSMEVPSCRLVNLLRSNKIKGRFYSGYESCTKKEPVPKCSGFGAFGDAVLEVTPSETDSQSVTKSSLANVGDKIHKHRGNNMDLIKCGPMKSRTILNRRRLRHTARGERDLNISNNTNLYSTTLLTCIKFPETIDSMQALDQPSPDSLSIIHIQQLNINMNAFPGDESANESISGNHQEVILENKTSSTTPSVDQFYTPESASPGHQVEVISGSALVECGEEVARLQSPPLESLTSVKDEPQVQRSLIEIEHECWEAKKHSIMMACNEAIKNRLQRQETEDEESREMTTSESTSAKSSREKRKKRKTKTTESVYVKFKTSLSKKLTTTTTLKEVKPFLQDISTKPLMFDDDHQNVLSLTSQSSEQSLAISQPRHTRIIKCAEVENQMRKRKLCSDTEVELLHSNESIKLPIGVSKSEKDGQVRECQIKKPENSFVKTFPMEEHSMEIDRQDFSQRSPTIPHGELVGECDRLSEKASAITVINVMETSANLKAENLESAKAVEPGFSESNQVEGYGQTSDLPLVSQPVTVSLDGSTSRERSKRRKKNHKEKGKGKSEVKGVDSKTRDAIGTSTLEDTPQGPQSDTSLSHTSKKVSHYSSTTKSLHHGIRSHSSPPEIRKKKVGSKKKLSVHLKEPLETRSKWRHKLQKKSSENKNTTRSGMLKEQTPRNTGSSSSTNSEKKRKSHTTASSISSDSVEDVQPAVNKAPPEIEQKQSETENTIPIVVDEIQKSLNDCETHEVTYTQNDVEDELASHNVQCQKSCAEKVNPKRKEIKSEKLFKTGEEKVVEHTSQPNESSVLKSKPKGHNYPSDPASVQPKPINKTTAKLVCTRLASRHQSKEKDLQKAEEGWNNSIAYSISDKGKVVGDKSRCVTRRTKLKYVIVKAKDKSKENKDNKIELLVQPAVGKVNSSDGEGNDQDVKQDGQGDSSLRGQFKTVQFSDSIEKIEHIKQVDVLEEVESIEEQVQEAHIGDNVSEGSLGDMFLSNNFDLVRELVEEEAEHTEKQPGPMPKLEVAPRTDKRKSSSPRRSKRPVWLKKAAPKPVDEPIVVEARVVVQKQIVSPKRLEKKKESFEEVILQPKKCNIQVTNPLPSSGVSPKRELPSIKTKVSYSSILSDVFLSLPLKKGTRRIIAEAGSPVDIKEVIEGSSVDAADYAKNLRFSPKVKRSVAAVFSTGVVRKKGPFEPGARDAPVGSGSAKSLMSRDTDAEYRLSMANCSFSTDLDEASVCRPVRSDQSNRSIGAARRKEKRLAYGRRDGSALPWHLVDADLEQENQERTVPSYRQIIETSIINLGLSWLMQEFFNRFDFLNPRRPLRSPHYREASELSIDPLDREPRPLSAV
ncbi:hypothetical protein EGW08_000381 [Elysia chlorotica]|uniref:Uncharacterized protein n=1 Tax=Elysia chlorotica TaxID=188477 RepID=A0A3S1I422_ELYCH|nr:hypothetical protein EGW08_000381 [Elysia chlorotica]